jgi:nucleotide-binding universal stress UspA family protein
VADELARYGADVDLLVIGAHDYGRAGTAPPSLAQRLANGASCALLVLPMPRHPVPAGSD